MSTQTISLNADYLKSRAGVLRVLEAVVGICGLISDAQGAYCGYGGMHSFYNFVVASTLILAVLLIVIYVISLDTYCTIINCPATVFANDVLFTVLYLVAAILMFITISACSYGQVARIFAALFGIAGTIVVGLLALDGYRTIRQDQSVPKTGA